MKFVSTRGRAPSVTAAEALVSGLAPDGGLYVPEHLPAPREDWEATADLTYAELAAEVLALFFTDWEKEELLTLCRKAYNGTFNMPGIIRVRKVGEKRYFTELFHGRTLAFKDMALSLFPHLLQAAKKKLGRTETTLILTATSGDTGKAALAGFQDVPGTEIVVFYPEHGVSPVQKWQMQTQAGENVHVYGVEGNFDDAQTFVKAAFEDPDLRAYAKDHGVAFSSANSINIGRLLPQIVYYIRTYAELVKVGEIKKGEAFDVCVPTGNFGNILAGYLAKQLGVPIAKLICASNENHVLTDFFRTGTYDRRREFHATHSPSMDILISSNLERFIYYLLDGDAQATANYLEELRTNGRFTLPESAMARANDFLCGWVDDEETVRLMGRMHKEHGYVMDPHTAVAVGVSDQLQEERDGRLLVIISTANPYKFPDTVAQALKLDTQDATDDFDRMWQIANISSLPLPIQFFHLREKQPRFHESVEKEDLQDVVRKTIAAMTEHNEN